MLQLFRCLDLTSVCLFEGLVLPEETLLLMFGFFESFALNCPLLDIIVSDLCKEEGTLTICVHDYRFGWLISVYWSR